MWLNAFACKVELADADCRAPCCDSRRTIFLLQEMQADGMPTKLCLLHLVQCLDQRLRHSILLPGSCISHTSPKRCRLASSPSILLSGQPLIITRQC